MLACSLTLSIAKVKLRIVNLCPRDEQIDIKMTQHQLRAPAHLLLINQKINAEIFGGNFLFQKISRIIC
jgi:hypothetical protein